jgi:hypothetical protein
MPSTEGEDPMNFQHQMIIKERHLFQWVIRCSFGEKFSGYAGNRAEAERKLRDHQKYPYLDLGDPPDIPRCKVCNTPGEYGARCTYSLLSAA